MTVHCSPSEMFDQIQTNLIVKKNSFQCKKKLKKFLTLHISSAFPEKSSLNFCFRGKNFKQIVPIWGFSSLSKIKNNFPGFHQIKNLNNSKNICFNQILLMWPLAHKSDHPLQRPIIYFSFSWIKSINKMKFPTSNINKITKLVHFIKFSTRTKFFYDRQLFLFYLFIFSHSIFKKSLTLRKAIFP